MAKAKVKGKPKRNRGNLAKKLKRILQTQEAIAKLKLLLSTT
jgi:hypothetical protein